MKRKLLLIIFLCIPLSFYANKNTYGKRPAGLHKKTLVNNTNNSVSSEALANEENNSGYTSIPDANFEAALSAYDDIPNDGQVPTANIETITNLDVPNAGISDLTGIADFRDLTGLAVNNNSISTIDVSNNTNLTFINARENGLNSLNITGCTAMGTLFIENNNLTTLDLSNNPQLTVVYAQENNFSSFDVTNNPLLEILAVTDSNLSSIDIANNTALEILWVQRNNITEIDVSTAPNLRQLLAQRNNLRILNVKNGNNTNITNFNVGNNPNLTCIEVDDVAYSNANWTISSQMFFADTSCYTQIPDPNFEAALDALGYDDISGDGQVPTGLIRTVINLNLENRNITDITGIESFEFLQIFDARFNNIATMDFSNNMNLEELYIQYTNLTTVNVSTLSNLRILDVFNNDLISIDVTNNPELRILNLRSNDNMASLDISNNTLLEKLNIRGLSITNIDLSNNTQLTELDAANGNLTTLDIRNGNNTTITTFNTVNNTNLACIFVDDATYSTTNWTNVDATTSFRDTNYCAYTAIPDSNFEAALEDLGYDDVSGDGQVPTELIASVTNLNISISGIADLTGLEDFAALEVLKASVNTFSSIDVSSNTALRELEIEDNTDFSSVLDVSNNLALETISVKRTNCTGITFGANTNLIVLEANNNQITSVDLNNLTALQVVDVSDNAIFNLNIKNNNNTNITSFDARNNATSTCILVDDVAYSTANWTNVDTQAFFSDVSCYTQIPDANFEAALSTYDDISNDGQVPTWAIRTETRLDVRESNISDLSGIEDFAALEELIAFGNNLTTLDLSNNATMKVLSARNNNISMLNLGTNVSYEIIAIGNNNVSSIDVSGFTSLIGLFLDNNPITSLDMSNNSALIVLDCNGCNLSSLDIKNGNNTNITLFDIQNNPNLNCVLVDDAAYAQTNFTDIDANVTFNDVACIDYTLIPDANFEAALDALGYDDISGDNRVPTANIEIVEELDIRSQNITDLTGIEDFTALKDLMVNFNNLTTVDLSANMALELLFINSNNLTTLDVSTNTNLKQLAIGDQNLASGIDLSANVNLTSLSATNANLSTLNLSNNTLLTAIDIRNNNLSNLDVTTLTALANLSVSNNNLTTIDLSNNTALRTFNFEFNYFSSLDFSGLANLDLINGSHNPNLTTMNLTGVTGLTAFQVNNTSLTALDVSAAVNLSFLSVESAQLEVLDLSNNTALNTIEVDGNNLISLDLRNIDVTQVSFFNANDNANLECIAVDDIALAEANLGENYPYSLDCAYTPIPDANFEAALFALGYDDIAGDGQVPKALVEGVTTLDVSNENIADLTGIKEFKAITNLNASGNQIEYVDLAQNTTLQVLNLANNNLILLNVLTLPNLTSLTVDTNDLFSLNIQNGANTNLSFFDATGNAALTCILVDSAAYANTNFTNIDSQTAFNETNCSAYVAVPDTAFENALSDYDNIPNDGQIPLDNIYFVSTLNIPNLGISDLTGIEGFVSLEELYCFGNSITSIDLTQNTELEILNVAANQLTALDLSQNAQLTTVICDFNPFTSLDFSNNSNLQYLSADDSAQLTSINLTGCAVLEELIIDDNSLNALDISTNVNLKLIDVDNNNLTTIDFSNNVLLENVDVKANQLTSIDISILPNLVEADLQDNLFTTVDFSNNPLLENVDIDGNQVTQLDFSANTALTRVDADENPLLVTIVFGNSPNLTRVDADETAIQTINVSTLTGLERLDLGQTNLTTLNVSSNTALEQLLVDNAALESLNLRNGNNSNLFTFNATNNPNLSCIAVDDVAYAQANFTNVDAAANFIDGYCRYTAIPDANFETALDNLGYDDISGDGQVPTALIEVVTNLDIPSSSIADLTGIEDFTALTFLNVNNNALISLDVTNLVNLEGLLISTNNLSTIDLSTLTQLTRFQGRFNTYTSLDFSNNLLLDDLNVDNNSNLATLNISQNTLLKSIDISDCAIANIDFSGLTNLLELDASNNLLTTVDFTDNILLTDVYLSGNPVTMVNVSNLSSLQYFDAFDAQLTSLNIKNGNNVNLQYFDVTNNPNLTCIVVDDVTYAQTNLTSVDAQITFNEIDCISPQITCPADITADSEAGICGATISIPVPVVVDDVVCVQNDDLEAYTEGLLLGQSNNWDTWTPNVTEQSGNISTEQARSGTKSLKMEGIPSGGPQDMVFKLGNRSSGAYELTYHLYVPAGNSAYSNVQKTENAGTEFASQVFFNSDGTGAYNINGTLTDFNYPQDTWFEVKILINIDGNHSEFFVDGTFVNSHPFSYTINSSNGLLTLGSVTFYPFTYGSTDPNPGAIPLFYVDDLSLCAVAVNDFNNSSDASDVYPVGTTDVVWSYADEGGNIATCTQMVTITDVDAPEVFGCIENITVACDEVVTYEAPIAIDTCEDIAIAGFTYLGGFEGKRYYLSDNNFNGPNAIIDAEAQNGFVAEIISQEHNDWLRAKFDELGEGKVIIGYSDTAVEGTFEWHNGNATTYTNWSSNEPNDFGSSGEDYTEMREDGQWNDTGTNASKKYLLEIAGTPMTQTAGLPSGSVFPVGTTTNTFEATDAQGNIAICSFDVIVEPCTDFTLELKVFLQGAAINPNIGEETLMRDDLRVAGIIPERSPYDNADSAPTAFDATGNDAIVDWVWVELRDKNDPTIVVEGRSYLLQRDGDIVARDGQGTPFYSMGDDTFYIAVHHRNHLTIMSNVAFTFNATNSVDFTNSSTVVTFGSNAQTTSGMPSGVAGMWCGNANDDTVVQYSGTSPDTPSVLSEVLNDAGNFLNFPTYSVTGYNMNDVNMDGVIQYSGTNPDTPFILQNVLASPANFLGFSTFSIIEQLPENLLNQ